jgi:hypothetical protein
MSLSQSIVLAIALIAVGIVYIIRRDQLKGQEPPKPQPPKPKDTPDEPVEEKPKDKPKDTPDEPVEEKPKDKPKDTPDEPVEEKPKDTPDEETPATPLDVNGLNDLLGHARIGDFVGKLLVVIVNTVTKGQPVSPAAIRTDFLRIWKVEFPFAKKSSTLSVRLKELADVHVLGESMFEGGSVPKGKELLVDKADLAASGINLPEPPAEDKPKDTPDEPVEDKPKDTPDEPVEDKPKDKPKDTPDEPVEDKPEDNTSEDDDLSGGVSPEILDEATRVLRAELSKARNRVDTRKKIEGVLTSQVDGITGENLKSYFTALAGAGVIAKGKEAGASWEVQPPTEVK